MSNEYGWCEDVGQCIERNKPLVYLTINKHFPEYLHDDDLIQYGLIGLWDASERYEPERGKFTTFACHCIRMRILQYLRHVHSMHEEFNEYTYSIDYPIISDGQGNELHLSDILYDTDAYTMFELSEIDMNQFLDSLSDRELKLFEYTRNGYTQNQIAQSLGVTQGCISRAKAQLKQRFIKFLRGSRFW